MEAHQGSEAKSLLCPRILLPPRPETRTKEEEGPIFTTSIMSEKRMRVRKNNKERKGRGRKRKEKAEVPESEGFELNEAGGEREGEVKYVEEEELKKVKEEGRVLF
jgi:hypothetical protein